MSEGPAVEQLERPKPQSEKIFRRGKLVRMTNTPCSSHIPTPSAYIVTKEYAKFYLSAMQDALQQLKEHNFDRVNDCHMSNACHMPFKNSELGSVWHVYYNRHLLYYFDNYYFYYC